MARRRSGVSDFLNNFNAAYKTTRGIGEDFALASAANAEAEDVAVGGYGADAEAQMAQMDRSPDQWQSAVGENQERTYTNLADPAKVQTFGLQTKPRQRIGTYEFDKGDEAGMRNARRRHIADTRGKFNAEAGLAMHDSISAAEQRDTQFKQSQEDRALVKARNALTSSVMALPKEQLDARISGFDFGSMGLPGYSIATTPEGYQMIQAGEGGASAVTDVMSPLQMRQFLLSSELAAAGFGEESLALYTNAVDGMDKRSQAALGQLKTIVDSHNNATAKGHSREDSRRDFGLRAQQHNASVANAAASRSLAERRFAYEQGQDAIRNELARDRLNASTATSGGTGGTGGLNANQAYTAYKDIHEDLALKNPEWTSEEVASAASTEMARRLGGSQAALAIAQANSDFSQLPLQINNKDQAAVYVGLAVSEFGLTPEEAVANVPPRWREAAQNAVNTARGEEARAYLQDQQGAAARAAAGAETREAARAATVEEQRARARADAEAFAAKQAARTPIGGLNITNALPQANPRVRVPEGYGGR